MLPQNAMFIPGGGFRWHKPSVNSAAPAQVKHQSKMFPEVA